MEAHLDTSVRITELLNLTDERSRRLIASILSCRAKAQKVTASTFTKKEFLFGFLKRLASCLAFIQTTPSYVEFIQWIRRLPDVSRLPDSALQAIAAFSISADMVSLRADATPEERDRALGAALERYLRVAIPEFWDRYDHDLCQPMPNRTQCPIALTGPIRNGTSYSVSFHKKCSASSSCAAPNMLRGEIARCVKIRKAIAALPKKKRTGELEKIKDVLDQIFATKNWDLIRDFCNLGVGDLIVAVETPKAATLVTTNEREAKCICPAIGQSHVIVK